MRIILSQSSKLQKRRPTTSSQELELKRRKEALMTIRGLMPPKRTPTLIPASSGFEGQRLEPNAEDVILLSSLSISKEQCLALPTLSSHMSSLREKKGDNYITLSKKIRKTTSGLKDGKLDIELAMTMVSQINQ